MSHATPAPGSQSDTRAPRRAVPGSLVAGAVVVGVVIVAGLLAPLLATHDPLQQVSGENLLAPSGAHLLGTDELNRDVFARVLYGIRTTLTVLAIAIPVGAVVGTAIGLLAASNRFVDVLVARFFDVIFVFPALVLGITVTALRGPGIATVIVAIAITEIPMFGRTVRNTALRVLGQPYIESARLAGASNFRILGSHVLPNSLEPLIVQTALSLSLGVFVEGAMSFIGVGVRPPDPSLGSILADAVYSWDANPGYPLGPLVVIVALSLGFLLIAQGAAVLRRG